MDVEKLIGALMQHFKFKDKDFRYFEFDLDSGFDTDKADQVDEIEVNGQKHKVYTVQNGGDEFGYHGHIAVCLHADSDYWFTAQWCE